MSRKRKTPPKVEDDEIYTVTVWDWEGNIVKKIWEATFDEAQEVQKDYADDPMLTVVIEDRQP